LRRPVVSTEAPLREPEIAFCFICEDHVCERCVMEIRAYTEVFGDDDFCHAPFDKTARGDLDKAAHDAVMLRRYPDGLIMQSTDLHHIGRGPWEAYRP
jgi:hypothetical protein